jgi:hypothetical protein
MTVQSKTDQPVAADYEPVVAVPARDSGAKFMRHGLAVVISLVIAAAALVLFTRNNDFPWDYYHPDEPGKVEQLEGSARWNFHHPVMLLQTARWIRPFMGATGDEQALVIVGRTASALLGAVGVFGAAMTGYAVFGFAGLLICGVAIALCPPLLIHAHYFKEDASLIGGIMLAMLGAVLTLKAESPRTQRLSAILLGIGCAAAASGKLVGVFAIVPAWVALRLSVPLEHPTRRQRRRTALLAALAGVVVINYQALLSLPNAIGGLLEEVGHGVGGHNNLRMSLINSFAMDVSLRETLPHVYPLLAASGLILLVVHRRITRTAVVIGSFLLTFVVVLALNQIPIPRYGLPITVLAWFCAAVALSGVVVSLRRVPLAAPIATAACVAGLIWLQWPRCQAMNAKFADDPRQQMYVYVATKTPANARIASEAFTSLHGSGDPWRFPDAPRRTQDVTYTMSAATIGSFDRLVEQGFDYVAVCDMNFERFLDPHVRCSDPGFLEQRRAFYRDLFTRGELVWSNTPVRPTNAYVDQDLRLYRIRPGR